MKAKVLNVLRNCKELLVIQVLGFSWTAILGLSGDDLVTMIGLELCLLIMCALIDDGKGAAKKAVSKKKVAKAAEDFDYMPKEVFA